MLLQRASLKRFFCSVVTSIEHHQISSSRREAGRATDILDSEEFNFDSNARRVKVKWRKKVVTVEGEILYGIHPINFALDVQRRTFHKIYYNGSSENPRLSGVIEKARSKGVPLHELDSYSLYSLSSTLEKNRGVHQGICADVSPLKPSWIKPESQYDYLNPSQLDIMLCGVGDPMNFGSILRSSYFFGVNRIFTSPAFPCAKLSSVVSKASAGALELFSNKIFSVKAWEVKAFFEHRKRVGWQIIGSKCQHETSAPDEKCFTEEKEMGKRRPVLLLIGNEGEGLTKELEELCDDKISLRGCSERNFDSLNVSVASALLINQILTKITQNSS